MRQKLIILPKLNDCHADPGKQWFVYYSCRDPRTGKMVRFRNYDGFTGLTPDEKYEHAKQLIETFSERLRAGWTPFIDDTRAVYSDHLEYKTVADLYGSRRAGNNTIRPWISKFLEQEKPGVKYETYLTYKSKFRIFVLWLESQGIGNNDIRTFDNNLIITFFRFIIDDRMLSRVSIKNYRMLLRRAFEYFRRQGIILINPVHDTPPCSRINDNAPRPIQRQDVEKFKKSIARDPELELSIKFMFYCGMRPGKEIRKLKIQDIDFISGIIHVNRDNAKNGKDRMVTIPQQFLDELRASGLSKMHRGYYIFGAGGYPGFKPIGKNKLGRHFKTIRDRMGMPVEYKHYSWKHTGAIEADEAGGIPFKDISDHLGHGDLQTTSIYFANKKIKVSESIRNNYPTL